MGQSIFQSSPEFAGAIEGARVVVGPRRMKKTRRGWGLGRGWGGGGGGTQAVGAGGPAAGPCGVLYGKNQRRGRRRVRRRRIFIQPPEMVERQLGVAFLMRSGSSCVGTAQPTFYYPKSACSSLTCSSFALLQYVLSPFLNTSLCIDSTMDYIWSKMSESTL